MYRPAAFDMTDAAELADFVTAAGRAHLVTLNGSTLLSSLVPLLLDSDNDRLVGHLARPNPQWRDVTSGVDALAIFAGADAYVSPSFYPTKRETGKVVPTWNYELVHVYGALTVHDDIDWLVDHVARLTDRHESGRDEPWSVDDAPDGFISALAKGIVGIELAISRTEGKRKLSQNRSASDVDGTIAALSNGSPRDLAVAEAMRRVSSRRTPEG